MLKLHQVVRLRVDLPEVSLSVGAIGTVVAIFEKPTIAYEVEFCDPEGRTLAEVALKPESVEPLTSERE